MKKKYTASAIQSELSIERTKMANRRTFLAYLRTSVALIVAGAGMLKFIQVAAWIAIGWICIALAPVIIVLGILDYIQVKKLIKKETEFMTTHLGSTDSEE